MMNRGMEWGRLFSDKATMIQGARFAMKLLVPTVAKDLSPDLIRGSYSCPGFFDDESKFFKRCKARRIELMNGGVTPPEKTDR